MGTEDKEIIKKKTKKKQKVDVNFNVIDDLEGKFILVKVGTQAEPASGDQIKEIEDKLLSLFQKNNINCIAFVTHHAVDMQIIEKQKIL